MAKPIIVSLDGIESSFEHAKLDRKRLYGERRRVPLDLSGEPCVKSALTSDGLYLLQSGMTAQGYFDESGRWLQKSQLIGIGSDGQALEPMPSTLGAVQPLQLIEPDVLLEHVVETVYALEATALDASLQERLAEGDVFRFEFNYSADYKQSTAFLLKNTEGIFCLIGSYLTATWSEPGKLAEVVDAEDSSEDLDFEMF
jgi:hypothetical protein